MGDQCPAQLRIYPMVGSKSFSKSHTSLTFMGMQFQKSYLECSPTKFFVVLKGSTINQVLSIPCRLRCLHKINPSVQFTCIELRNKKQIGSSQLLHKKSLKFNTFYYKKSQYMKTSKNIPQKRRNNSMSNMMISLPSRYQI